MTLVLDPTLIDPRWDGKALIAAAVLLLVTLAVIAWRDAGRRIDETLPSLLDPPKREPRRHPAHRPFLWLEEDRS